jgi:PadR family transcriptional regulator, regulatory protein PadR
VAAQNDLPGGFEQLVMLAVTRLSDNAYGMTVRAELEERTGRRVSLGAVYSTLDRLEAKGYVSSRQAQGGAEREGRARRFFKVTAAGVRALNEGIAALDRMREGVASFPKPARAT